MPQDVPGSPTRRGLLKAGLAAGAVVGAGAWRSAASGTAASGTARPAARALRQPGSRPHPGLATGTDTIPQIKHIVVLMMENHSYDNHLGMLGRAGADGFTVGSNGRPTAANPYANGQIQHAFRMPTTCQLFGKPSQNWTDTHTQLDGGKLDGFVRSGSGPVSMGYWERADLPFYYSLASAFPIADHYFCSVLGQTFPNRRYLMAATSIGMINDTVPGLTDYPANGTIFDRLHDAGVTWKDYVEPLSPTPTLALFPPLLVKYPSHLATTGDFFADAKAGTLPGFSLVEPNYVVSSEEEPQNIALGEQFAASVVNAVMSGPGWKNTLLIWTFDEHGGYYDHVVAAGGHPAGRHPAGHRQRSRLHGLRAVRLPGALRGRLPVRAEGLRLPHGVRSHQHPGAGRGQVEFARPDPARRERPQHAGHARPGLGGLQDATCAGQAAGQHPSRGPAVHRDRTGDYPPGGLGVPGSVRRKRGSGEGSRHKKPRLPPAAAIQSAGCGPISVPTAPPARAPAGRVP